MNHLQCIITGIVAVSVSSAVPVPVDINQIQEQLQQIFPQLQFPTSGGVQAEISLPPFLQSKRRTVDTRF